MFAPAPDRAARVRRCRERLGRRQVQPPRTRAARACPEPPRCSVQAGLLLQLAVQVLALPGPVDSVDAARTPPGARPRRPPRLTRRGTRPPGQSPGTPYRLPGGAAPAAW